MTRSLDIEGVVKAYALEKYQNSLVMILEDFGGEFLVSLLKRANPSEPVEEDRAAAGLVFILYIISSPRN